ncbi:hypothetical protein [Kribbella amoyensis]|uniref:hypothetical protein n=1 Tax=Kribbella amoyensis TaxID=996641 RepID=UPI0011A5BCC3|nr:hypothetical protein [Kribbella amoyensis]
MATLFVEAACLAGDFLAGALVAGVFFVGVLAGSVVFAALFSAAALRLGADFFADVAMLDYPLPSSETEADWSQDSRPRGAYVPADAQTVDIR